MQFGRCFVRIVCTDNVYYKQIDANVPNIVKVMYLQQHL